MSQREEDPVAASVSADEGGLGTFKDCLAELRFRIRLDDLVNATVRETLVQTSGEKVSAQHRECDRGRFRRPGSKLRGGDRTAAVEGSAAGTVDYPSSRSRR